MSAPKRIVRGPDGRAAEKTAAALAVKTIKPTKKAVIAAVRKAPPEIVVDVAEIWRETAAHLAEMSDTHDMYRKLAVDLLAWLEARIEDDDEEILFC